MAEAARITRRNLLGLMGKISSALLAALGVITSGCGYDPVAYGIYPPDHILILHGRVMSAEDSTGIRNIVVEVEHDEQSYLGDAALSEADGSYEFENGVWATDYPSWPDSIPVHAWDLEHNLYGAYLSRDTVIFAPYLGTVTEINLDLYLQPEEE